MKIIPLIILSLLLILPCLSAGEYNITTDPDVNSYTENDMTGLATAGIGEGLRATNIWIGTFVLLIVVTFISFQILAFLVEAQ